MMDLSQFSFQTVVSKDFLAWSALFSIALLLQLKQSGTITGAITDTNGAVLVGVNITANHTETGLSRTTTSGDEGRFVFPGLPVGDYLLHAESNGFEALDFPNVKLTVNDTTTVALVMKVSTVTADLTINSGEALVNTQTAELSYLVNEQAIRDLPLNGRNYTDLAFLQPGVIPYAHRDGGSVVAHGMAMSINGQDPRSKFICSMARRKRFHEWSGRKRGQHCARCRTIQGVSRRSEFPMERSLAVIRRPNKRR